MVDDNQSVVNQGLSTDDESSLTVEDFENNHIVQLDNDSIFQARIFLEEEANVYGAEVIVFGGNLNEPIDRILITNLNEFNKYKNVVDLIRNNYIPYTEQDKNNMSIILNYLSSDTQHDASEISEYNHALNNDSYLKKKGDLQSILENTIVDKIGEDVLSKHHEDEEVIINATHLNGVEEGLFERKGHTHTNIYLENSHASTLGTDSEYGHVKIKDNLTTTTNNSEALSAKQGNVLKNDINSLNKKLINGWVQSSLRSDSRGTLTYMVNELLHLIVLDFQYNNSTIFKKSTGVHELEPSGKIKEKYRPTHRVTAPLYQGDLVIMFNTDGGIKVHNLTKHDTWNITGQVMWYYK